MSRGTERRSIRIDGELWAAAQELAGRRGDNLSEILRGALVAYVERDDLDVDELVVAELRQGATS